MDAGGAQQTRLTTNTVSDDDPVWSPDGTQIAFISDRDVNLNVYLMNADGTGQLRLTNVVANDPAPDWQRIAPFPAPPPVGRLRSRATATATTRSTS